MFADNANFLESIAIFLSEQINQRKLTWHSKDVWTIKVPNLLTTSSLFLLQISIVDFHVSKTHNWKCESLGSFKTFKEFLMFVTFFFLCPFPLSVFKNINPILEILEQLH